MKVISIDASTKSTGVAVFDNEELIFYDCITASSTDVIKRIEKISNRLNEILDYFKPEKLILEEVRPENQYGAGNIQTHRVLMWLQAEINFLCHKKTPIIEVDYIYPNEWRSYIGIHTGAGVRREALKKKTGFDTTAAVQHIQEEKETNEVVKTEAPKRRVQPKEEASEPARRSTTNYKVVTKQED